MKANIKIICSNCGKIIKVGNTNGMPNGVGFIDKEDNMVNLCQSCLIQLGGMSDSEKNDFFDRLGIPVKGE